MSLSTEWLQNTSDQQPSNAGDADVENRLSARHSLQVVAPTPPESGTNARPTTSSFAPVCQAFLPDSPFSIPQKSGRNAQPTSLSYAPVCQAFLPDTPLFSPQTSGRNAQPTSSLSCVPVCQAFLPDAPLFINLTLIARRSGSFSRGLQYFRRGGTGPGLDLNSALRSAL